MHLCSVDQCAKPARSGGSLLCEMHYYRLRRTGRTDLANRRKPVLTHSNGYRVVYRPDHCLADKNGYVYEHRMVLHTTHGDGPFRCHVCQAPQSWATMHVDHMNDVRDDNRAENLAPACPECNQHRGHPKVAASNRVKVAIELRGERLTAPQWGARLGISANSIKRRLAAGWSVERALTEPRGVFGPPSRADRQRG